MIRYFILALLLVYTSYWEYISFIFGFLGSYINQIQNIIKYLRSRFGIKELCFHHFSNEKRIHWSRIKLSRRVWQGQTLMLKENHIFCRLLPCVYLSWWTFYAQKDRWFHFLVRISDQIECSIIRFDCRFIVHLYTTWVGV